MSHAAKNKIRETVATVLEEFAFMFVEEDETADEDALETADCVHVTMTFSGPTDGVVALTAPYAFCRELAANVLGMDTYSVSEPKAIDAVKELLNVICGALVSALDEEAGATYSLAPPSACRIGKQKWHELRADPEAVEFIVDDHRVVLGLLAAKETAPS